MSTVFRVEKTADYTVMANYHLKDRRLSYKAKGLLSEILSLPPDWDYTLSGLAVIAADGKDSVRTAIHELEQYGYLVRFQLRDDLGRMSVNEYVVYESPEQNPHFKPTNGEDKPKAEKKAKPTAKGSVKRNSPSSGNPTTAKKVTENPSSENPTTEKPRTDTIKKLNTNKSNTHQSIIRADARGTDRTEGFDERKNVSIPHERDHYRKIIRENIEYDFLYENQHNPILGIDIRKVDEIVEVMVDVVCSSSKTIRVNGTELPQEDVKNRFLELNQSHIDYVITARKRNNNAVRNIRAYLITALYNAPVTIDSYYEEWVKQYMYGG